MYFSDRTLSPRAAYADTVWALRAGDPEIMAHPAEAELRFWVDHLPGEDRDELLGRFEDYVADFCAADQFLASRPIELERSVMRPFVGIGIDPNHEIVRYSDTPAVNFGGGEPVSGNAHAPDEHVAVETSWTRRGRWRCSYSITVASARRLTGPLTISAGRVGARNRSDERLGGRVAASSSGEEIVSMITGVASTP